MRPGTASDSCWVSIAGKADAAVGKRNNPHNGNGYILFNELICHRLAEALDLPVPGSFIVAPPGEDPIFCQLNFNEGGPEPPPVNAADVVSQFGEMAYRLVAFDVLVFNTDRHRRNLAVARSELVVFDHSHAILGGRGQSPGLGRLAKVRTLSMGCDGHIGNRHCLLGSLTSAAALEDAVKHVGDLPDTIIQNAVREATGYGMRNADSAAVREALLRRRDSLARIVERNQPEFKGIVQWTLGGTGS